jgi:hypothetical protein|tara:strand:+ start:694 stop:906 length:213 start_codon:yes stop_codon:yes gene_type:complete
LKNREVQDYSKEEYTKIITMAAIKISTKPSSETRLQHLMRAFAEGTELEIITVHVFAKNTITAAWPKYSA